MASCISWTGLGKWMLLLVALDFGLQFSVQDDIVCNNQLSPCSCDTNQGLLDLKPLDSGDAPRFKDIPFSDDEKYDYSPCQKFTMTASGTERSECNDIAACQKYGDDYWPIGKLDTAQFANDPQTNDLQIQYSSTSTSGDKSSAVTLACDPNVEGDLQAMGETPPFSSNFAFTLKSKYCCPGASGGGGGGGLSVGSILCIAFVVLLSVYLIVGVAFNYLARGARGIELIPNVDSWKKFPGLVKDGAKFTFGKITRDGSYTEM